MEPTIEELREKHKEGVSQATFQGQKLLEFSKDDLAVMLMECAELAFAGELSVLTKEHAQEYDWPKESWAITKQERALIEAFENVRCRDGNVSIQIKPGEIVIAESLRRNSLIEIEAEMLLTDQGREYLKRKGMRAVQDVENG
jgi:hypothetical protein